MLKIEKINVVFRRLTDKILRFRWLSILLFVVLVGISVLGVGKIEGDVDQDNWFLEDDQMLAAKERFEAIFGNDEFCAVLVEVDDVFTPQVLQSIRVLGKELEANVPFADEVVSLTDFEFTEGTEEGLTVADLVPEVIPESGPEMEQIRNKALFKPSLKNRMVSADSRETWIVLRMKALPDPEDYDGDESPDLIVGHTFNRIVNQPQYAHLNPRTAGMPVVVVDKNDFFAKETPRLLGSSFIVTFLLLAVFLRSVRGVVIPLITALSTLVVVFGIQGHLGVRTDPSMIFMPVFITLAVSIGYSVHVFSHFNQSFRLTGKRRDSVLAAMEEVGWPLMFSAMTTVAALLSFLLIPLRPIRWVGLTSASLVGLAVVLVLVLLPVLLSFGHDRQPKQQKVARKEPLLQRFMAWLGARVLLRPRTSLIILVVTVLVCCAGVLRVDVSFDILKTFGLKVPYVNRIYQVGQSQVGSLYSYDVALEFDQPGAAKDPQNLKKFEQLVGEVESMELTKKTTSVLQIIKDMNQVLHANDPAYYRIPDEQTMVAQLLLLYENAGGVEVEKWVDYDYQRLRLMVEMGHYNSGEATRELRRIQQRGKELFPDAHVVLTGAVSQFSIMQDYVSYGQIKSFILSLVVIAVLMMLVFGSVRTGLIGMIPNIAPALVVGAIMGFSDLPLDMITVTIMPMLLGLAVDDTIHFINHSQLEFERTGNYTKSIKRTFSSVGGALFMTTVILSCTFAVYSISVVHVFVNMGMLIGAGLFAALFADYFISPVLLKMTKPFGPERNRV